LAPSETKEEGAHRVRAGDVGTLATLGSSAHTNRKKDDGTKLRLTGTLRGDRSGQAVLRMEQRERFESNLHENQAMGGKGENDRRHKHSSRKRIKGNAPVGYSGWIALRR
jgi:hypothetical protein